MGCSAVSTTTARIAWQQLVGALTALAIFAALLPNPLRWVDGLGERSTAPLDGGLSTVEAALLLVAALAVWSLLLWGSAVALVALTARLPGGPGRRGRSTLSQIAPGVARNLILTAVGVSVISSVVVSETGVATALSVVGMARHPGAGPNIGRPANDTVGLLPATAAPVSSWISVEGSVVTLVPQLSDPAGGSAAVSAPGLNIDWPATPSRARAAAPKGLLDIDWPDTASPVVVIRGDSLWSIAARHLAAGASDAQIEVATQQWFIANAAVIGENPNLIFPGQILQPPHQETEH